MAQLFANMTPHIRHQCRKGSGLGFFNEADTLESNSVLIYLQSTTGLYTRKVWWDAVYIKMVIKLGNLIRREGRLNAIKQAPTN